MLPQSNLQNSTIEQIKARYSCRNYLDTPIEAEVKYQLEQFAADLPPGPFGSVSRFSLAAARSGDRDELRDLGTYGLIRGATGYLIGAMLASAMNLEDFGYQMERLILYATGLGLGTCWLGGTFTKSSFGERMPTSEGEIIPAVVSVGYPAGKKRMVERIIRGRAEADRRLPWEQLFFDSSFERPLMAGIAGDYALPLEMVRRAPSASNKQPWRVVREGSAWHFYLERTPGYRERFLVRLVTRADLQRIDMGIAMSHFELACKELRLTGSWRLGQPRHIGNARAEYLVTWVGTG